MKVNFSFHSLTTLYTEFDNIVYRDVFIVSFCFFKASLKDKPYLKNKIVHQKHFASHYHIPTLYRTIKIDIHG